MLEYSCPVPECAELGALVEALADHVRSEHRLYSVDEVALYLDISPAQLSAVRADHSSLSTPRWYSQTFVDALALCRPRNNRDLRLHHSTHDLDSANGHASANDGSSAYSEIPLSTFLNTPYDFRPHRVAQMRYKKYIETETDHEKLIRPVDKTSQSINVLKHLTPSDKSKPLSKAFDGEVVIDRIYEQVLQDCEIVRHQCISRKHADADPADLDIAAIDDPVELASIHAKLESRLATAQRINETLSATLAHEIAEKRKAFLLNEILLDANIHVGLPPKELPAKQRVIRDELDSILLDE